MIRQATSVQLYPRGFKFSTGEKIYFKYGDFDDWCVHIKECAEPRRPKDVEYLSELRALAEIHGSEKVYNAFRLVYDVVKSDSNQQECLKVCKKASSYFQENTLLLWITFFMTMMAEENRANAILGKRIKHLAVIQTLNTTEKIDIIANSMRGKRWWQLDAQMQEYGI